jgi:hypothetical protein
MDALATVVAIGFVVAIVGLVVWVFGIAPFVIPRRSARR